VDLGPLSIIYVDAQVVSKDHAGHCSRDIDRWMRKTGTGCWSLLPRLRPIHKHCSSGNPIGPSPAPIFKYRKSSKIANLLTTSATPLINLGDGLTQDRTPQCPPGLTECKLGHDDQGICLTMSQHARPKSSTGMPSSHSEQGNSQATQQAH
jgi:hypothetical protein